PVASRSELLRLGQESAFSAAPGRAAALDHGKSRKRKSSSLGQEFVRDATDAVRAIPRAVSPAPEWMIRTMCPSIRVMLLTCGDSRSAEANCGRFRPIDRGAHAALGLSGRSVHGADFLAFPV